MKKKGISKVKVNSKVILQLVIYAIRNIFKFVNFISGFKIKMTLKEFLDEEDPKRNLLEVKVIKSTSAYKFIIGDASSLALLDLTKNPTHAKGSI